MSCERCGGLGILPNQTDALDGPECACGRPSRFESGWCGRKHPICVCDCDKGKELAKLYARRPTPMPEMEN